MTLIPPDAVRRIGWRARYMDRDAGKLVKVSLDPTLTTLEQREQWAVRKSRELAKRRAELAGGAARLNGVPIEEAVKQFKASCTARLRSRSVETYDGPLALFEEWAARMRIRTTAELTGPRLATLRESMLSRPRHRAKVGGKRGERHQTEEKLSPHTVNSRLRVIKTAALFWRTHGLVPLDRDAITDALKMLKAPKDAPSFLSPADCDRLLESALRHDAETYASTREEHAGLRAVGTMPRYAAIAPFTAFLLLTGCRLGEALALQWKDVDLTAVDAEGHVVGEIRLMASATKTAQSRTIGLEVCPALRALLAAMKLRAGTDAYVFGGKKAMAETLADSARKRLVATYGAPPDFSWQMLRRTCGTFLTNSPAIFGAASVFMSARQLGHSVQVAEKHYLGVLRGVPRTAKTLEEAMQIQQVMARVLARASDLDSARPDDSGVTSSSRPLRNVVESRQAERHLAG